MTALHVHSLHALAYCERLFYLEEVENLRVADARVYAGRRLHVEIEREEAEGEWLTLTLESSHWGIVGKVDCIRRRDGMLIPYEHKRGRSARNDSGEPDAWSSDRLQIIAYAALIGEHSGKAVNEGRIRYHADNVMVRVPIDGTAWRLLSEAVSRARELQASVVRPPVTENERLCVNCSLASVCLPEEARLAKSLDEGEDGPQKKRNDERMSGRNARSSPIRLFPADDDRRSLHVVTPGAHVGRKGDRIEVVPPKTVDSSPTLYPVQEIGQIVLHGFVQISTQALGFCSQQEVGVHWLTGGGRYLGSWNPGVGSVQRRIRQYKALTNSDLCLRLAKRLVEARVRGQLSFLLRTSRQSGHGKTADVDNAIAVIRQLLSPLLRANSIHSLRGYEGSIGAQYFKALPHLISDAAGDTMKPEGRSRRPPRDYGNALLSFAYALLLRDVMNAILVVGLDPSLGFYHQPRSQAPPLGLDLMELFRVPLVDLPIVASINRRQWDETADFQKAGQQVWLSDSGKKKLIAIYERRKSDQWKHPVIGYSLSYSRLLELEVRLLEKDFMGEGGLFARMRMR